MTNEEFVCNRQENTKLIQTCNISSNLCVLIRCPPSLSSFAFLRLPSFQTCVDPHQCGRPPVAINLSQLCAGGRNDQLPEDGRRDASSTAFDDGDEEASGSPVDDGPQGEQIWVQRGSAKYKSCRGNTSVNSAAFLVRKGLGFLPLRCLKLEEQLRSNAEHIHKEGPPVAFSLVARDVLQGVY